MSSQSVQAISIPTETIQCFVSEFRSDINSVRCESRISSLSDLIGVLVKRNVLNIQTYEIILQNVLSALQPTEQNILKSYLRFILGNNNFDGQNIYDVQRAQNGKIAQSNNAIVQSSTVRGDQTSLIFKIIAADIEDWRSFARELNISESQIIELEELRLDINTVAHRVLEKAKQMYEAELNDRIKNALIEIKRRDIIRKLNSRGLLM